MSVAWAEQEFAGSRLWDHRCRRSLARIATAVAERHGQSFSAACGPALRQAAHRIFAHTSVSVADLLQGHYQQTRERCRTWLGPTALLLVAQDTTDFSYAGHHATTGLGPIGGRTPGRGLLAHTALALTPTGLPLGLLWVTCWCRDPATHGKGRTRLQRATAEKETQKWLDGLAGIEAALPPEQPVLVVADRGADFYDYFAAPRRRATHLLVRAHQPRRVQVLPTGEAAAPAPITDLFHAVQDQPEAGRLTLTVGRRPGQPEREAVLALRRARVQLLVPRDYRRRCKTPGKPLTVWVVEAREVDPPAGVEPIHWVLLTTLPLDDAALIPQVLHYYACRWGIERLHFTLKSGLRVERLQFDDATSLQHALAVCCVAAWRLLWLTHLARTDPGGALADVLTAEEATVLGAAVGAPVTTRREAVRAIARLGGFPGNPAAGEPGVKSLWLGMARLEAMLEGWRLARAVH